MNSWRGVLGLLLAGFAGGLFVAWGASSCQGAPPAAPGVPTTTTPAAYAAAIDSLERYRAFAAHQAGLVRNLQARLEGVAVLRPVTVVKVDTVLPACPRTPLVQAATFKLASGALTLRLLNPVAGGVQPTVQLEDTYGCEQWTFYAGSTICDRQRTGHLWLAPTAGVQHGSAGWRPRAALALVYRPGLLSPWGLRAGWDARWYVAGEYWWRLH